MAFTYGFYNSLNGDRRYDAIQLSSKFDGIIQDGIFMSIGSQLMVQASNNMMVTVGPGRAWFNHTWSCNDAPLLLIVDQAEVLQDRIDTVILEVNAEEAVRENSIYILKGSPSVSPQPPDLIRSIDRNQYALADIYVTRNTTVINTADITNRVGTDDAPFVTGLLEVINITNLVAQWGDQWYQFFNAQTEDITSTNTFWKNTWYQYYTTLVDQTITQQQTWKDTLQAYLTGANEDLQNWRTDREETFDEWFQTLVSTLEAADATMLLMLIQNHLNGEIASEIGIHNYRHHKKLIQHWNGEEWETLKTKSVGNKPFAFTEMDDLYFRSGTVVNPGAGWNLYKFDRPMVGSPIVTLSVLDAPYDNVMVDLSGITEEGFMYQVREILSSGASETVSDAVEINYIALYEEDY